MDCHPRVEDCSTLERDGRAYELETLCVADRTESKNLVPVRPLSGSEARANGLFLPLPFYGGWDVQVLVQDLRPCKQLLSTTRNPTLLPLRTSKLPKLTAVLVFQILVQIAPTSCA